MSKQPQRVLPADVYDALELSATAFGGIGADHWFIDEKPCCARGHAMFVMPEGGQLTTCIQVLTGVGISADVNDDAVWTINERRGRSRNSRVPFAEWCKELNVVRGE